MTPSPFALTPTPSPTTNDLSLLTKHTKSSKRENKEGEKQENIGMKSNTARDSTGRRNGRNKKKLSKGEKNSKITAEIEYTYSLSLAEALYATTALGFHTVNLKCHNCSIEVTLFP